MKTQKKAHANSVYCTAVRISSLANTTICYSLELLPQLEVRLAYPTPSRPWTVTLNLSVDSTARSASLS